MDLKLAIITAGTAYLALGFGYGIFREWSYETIKWGGDDYSWFRIVCGAFNFPLLVFMNKEAEDTNWAIIDDINGAGYWFIVAFTWPFFLAISIIEFTATVLITILVLLIIVLVFSIDFLSRSKRLKRAETWVKKRFDIYTAS